MAASPLPAGHLMQAIEGVVKVLTSLLGGPKDAPSPDAAGGEGKDGQPPTELADMDREIKEISDGMDKMRGDLGAFGRSVGTIATGVLGALGYTRFNDIFPFPLGAPGWLGWATSVAAGLGLFATTFLVFRFFFAKRRILLDIPTPDQVHNASKLPPWKGETKLVIKYTQRYADREEGDTLWDVDRRQAHLALRSRALAQDPATRTEAAAAWAEAYRLEKVVDLALWDASSAVLERRTRGAFGGPVATLAIMLSVGGIGFTFATADWAKGRRSLPEQRVREAQVCSSEARASNSADIDAFVRACIAKAKADLSATTTAATTTTPTTTDDRQVAHAPA